jgi:hypothetical protein
MIYIKSKRKSKHVSKDYKKLVFETNDGVVIYYLKDNNHTSVYGANVNICTAYDNGRLLMKRNWKNNEKTTYYYKPAPKQLKKVLGLNYYTVQFKHVKIY